MRFWLGAGLAGLALLSAAPSAAQDDTLFKFASDVFADQEIEIAVMQKMLESVGK